MKYQLISIGIVLTSVVVLMLFWKIIGWDLESFGSSLAILALYKITYLELNGEYEKR